MAQKKGEVSTLIYLESNVRRVFFVLQDIAKNNYWINVFEKLTKIKKIKWIRTRLILRRLNK